MPHINITCTTTLCGTTTTEISIDHPDGRGGSAGAPAPPAQTITPVAFDNGCFGYAYTAIWTDAAAQANLAKWQVYIAQQAQLVGGSYYALMYTDTEETVCAIFPSSEKWLEFNEKLAAIPGMMEYLSGCTLEGRYWGDTSVAARAKANAWNGHPNCNVEEMPLLAGFLRPCAMGTDGWGWFCDIIYTCEEGRAKTLAAVQAWGALVNNFFEASVVFDTGVNTGKWCAMFKKDEDWAKFNESIQSNKELVGDFVAGMAQCNVTCYGKTSPRVKAMIEGWNSVPHFNVVQDTVPLHLRPNTQNNYGYNWVAKWESEEALADWGTKSSPQAQAAARHNGGFMVHTTEGCTERCFVVLPSIGAWLNFNKTLGCSPALGEAISKIKSLDCQVFGEQNAASKQSTAAWDAVPNFSITTQELTVGFLGVPKATSSTWQLIMRAEHNGELAAAWQAMLPLCVRHAVNFVYLEDSSTSGTAFFHTNHDTDWLAMHYALKEVPHIGAAFVGSLTSLTTEVIGPCSMATRAAVAEWNAIPHINATYAVPSAGLGYDGVMGFFNRFSYGSEESLLKAHEASKTWADVVGKRVGALSYVTTRTGPTTLTALCVFANNSQWHEANLLFKALPNIMDIFTDATTECTVFGGITQASKEMIEGWTAVPGFSLHEEPIFQHFAPMNQEDDRFAGFNICEFKDGVGADAWSHDLSADAMKAYAALRDANDETNIQFQLGPSTLLILFWFPSCDHWLESNFALKEIPEVMGKMGSLKDMQCFCYGKVNAEGEKALAEWDQTPGFNINRSEVMSGY